MTQSNSYAPWFGEETWEKTIILLMTLVLIQTAVITYWFILADDSQGDAGRDAQIFAMRGLGQRMTGNLQTGYAETVAYQRWSEYTTLANLADSDDDPLTAKRYRAARDRIAKLSPLLQKPYLNPPDSVPDTWTYQADTFLVETVAQAERFANQYTLKSFWYDKASAFATQLTLLAVALFLFGLANTTKNQMRWVFAGSGVTLGLIVFGWSLVAQNQTIEGLPDPAMQQYARGVGLAHQGKFAQAVAAFDQATQLAPNYANVYRERGFAQFEQGNYAHAIVDFQNARTQGDASADVAGALAWAYYVQGDLPNAIAMNRIALAKKSGEEWIEYDLALALLAAGDLDAAQAQYTASMNTATKNVSSARAAGKQPPATLWWSLDTSANDLTNLVVCLNGKSCVDTPALKNIAAPSQIQALAAKLAVQLRELSVALEYTDKPPQGSLAATISPFRFTQDDPKNARAKFSSVIEESSKPIYMVFDYTGLRAGDLVIVKVWVAGVEDLGLRVVEEFAPQKFGSSGKNAFLPFSLGDVPLDAGVYRVEFFVNARLAQQGEFTIEEE